MTEKTLLSVQRLIPRCRSAMASGKVCDCGAKLVGVWFVDLDVLPVVFIACSFRIGNPKCLEIWEFIGLACEIPVNLRSGAGIICRRLKIYWDLIIIWCVLFSPTRGVYLNVFVSLAAGSMVSKTCYPIEIISLKIYLNPKAECSIDLVFCHFYSLSTGCCFVRYLFSSFLLLSIYHQFFYILLTNRRLFCSSRGNDILQGSTLVKLSSDR